MNSNCASRESSRALKYLPLVAVFGFFGGFRLMDVIAALHQTFFPKKVVLYEALDSMARKKPFVLMISEKKEHGHIWPECNICAGKYFFLCSVVGDRACKIQITSNRDRKGVTMLFEDRGLKELHWADQSANPERYWNTAQDILSRLYAAMEKHGKAHPAFKPHGFANQIHEC